MEKTLYLKEIATDGLPKESGEYMTDCGALKYIVGDSVFNHGGEYWTTLQGLTTSYIPKRYYSAEPPVLQSLDEAAEKFKKRLAGLDSILIDVCIKAFSEEFKSFAISVWAQAAKDTKGDNIMKDFKITALKTAVAELVQSLRELRIFIYDMYADLGMPDHIKEFYYRAQNLIEKHK